MDHGVQVLVYMGTVLVFICFIGFYTVQFTFYTSLQLFIVVFQKDIHSLPNLILTMFLIWNLSVVRKKQNFQVKNHSNSSWNNYDSV